MRTPRKWISGLLLAGALVAAAGISRISAVEAEDAVVIDGQDAPNLDGGKGMKASNPRVKPLLEAYPDKFVVLCVAGCSGPKAKVVQLLPKPVRARSAAYVPSAGTPDVKSARGRYSAGEGDDVICLAGCSGRPGQVVQRNLDLPPLPLPPKPAPAPEKTTEAAPPKPAPTGPEPLDVHP